MSSEATGVLDLAFIQSRIASGDRVRFYHDFYGGNWIELTPRWQFWRKKRMQLGPVEVTQLKSILRERPQLQ